MPYPVVATLSFEAFQASETLDCVAAATRRFPGLVGACVSPPDGHALVSRPGRKRPDLADALAAVEAVELEGGERKDGARRPVRVSDDLAGLGRLGEEVALALTRPQPIGEQPNAL